MCLFQSWTERQEEKKNVRQPPNETNLTERSRGVKMKLSKSCWTVLNEKWSCFCAFWFVWFVSSIHHFVLLCDSSWHRPKKGWLCIEKSDILTIFFNLRCFHTCRIQFGWVKLWSFSPLVFVWVGVNTVIKLVYGPTKLDRDLFEGVVSVPLTTKLCYGSFVVWTWSGLDPPQLQDKLHIFH